MGLDMYLEGRNYFAHDHCRKSGKFRVKSETLDLGYWRKHPNLHGYIVQNFAEGVDECQEIELTVENLEQILKASEEDQLPQTSGFFFGTSMPEDKPDTKKILTAAIKWLKKKEENVFWKSVIYRASW